MSHDASAQLLAERFTLVIPTYNRAADVARLLRFLEAHRVRFRVLVLDSSTDEARTANAALIAGLSIPIELCAFDPATHPFEKFALGLSHVTTDYSALCADDDLVLPDSIAAILRFLDARSDYVAAHGWYFSFDHTATFDIPTVVYHGDSIDASAPLHRLHECMRRYEALTYAVYRTTDLRCALNATRRVESIMAKELLGSAVVALRGKVARLEQFYYGRSLAPSQSYANWVPVHFLANSARQMFTAYQAYREVLLETLAERDYQWADRATAVDLIDLIHLRYLADYAKPAVLDELIAGKLRGESPERMAKDVLPLLVEASSPIEQLARRSRWLRSLRNKTIPNVRLAQLQRVLPHRVIASRTAGGHARRYRFFRAFLRAVAPRRSLANGLTDLVAALDRYE